LIIARVGSVTLNMIPPLHLDGITYTPELIKSTLEPVVDIRDCLMQAGQLPHAMSLCVVHALLKHLANNTSEQ